MRAAAHQETQVFVDATGRRARRVRAVAAVAAMTGTLVLGALIDSALGMGQLPQGPTVAAHAPGARPIAATGPIALAPR